jgi:fructose-1,6-bisphosphatase/inositol monophosphatase family enzyme
MSSLSPFTEPRADLVARIESAVLAAARYLVQASISGERPDVQIKADHTMVMNLDLESQRRILAGLGSDFPIVAEEDESSHRLIESSRSYFLVDPLDGTTSCKRFLGQLGGHVGYGPLVGYVEEHQLTVASFFNIPQRALFTAVRGEGCFISYPDLSDMGAEAPSRRTRLVAASVPSLEEAGMLFFISKMGEAAVVHQLKLRNSVENIYRFGGFANDSARLAQGYEQIQLQCLVKPWDFTAVLLAREAGYEVIVDPLGERVPLAEWRMKANNPILAILPNIKEAFFAELVGLKG